MEKLQNLDFFEIIIPILKNAQIIMALFLIHFVLKHRHPFLNSLKSAIPGIISLIFLNIFDSFTGIKMPLNSANIGVSALLGLPGVGVITILNTIFAL